MVFNSVLEKNIRAAEEKGKLLQLNRLHQLFANAEDICLVGEEIKTIQKNTVIIQSTIKEAGLARNVSKTKYMITSIKKSQDHWKIRIGNDNVEKGRNVNI